MQGQLLISASFQFSLSLAPSFPLSNAKQNFDDCQTEKSEINHHSGFSGCCKIVGRSFFFFFCFHLVMDKEFPRKRYQYSTGYNFNNGRMKVNLDDKTMSDTCVEK